MKTTNEKMPKNAENFYCKICDFKCCKESNFQKHLSTLKHKIRTNTNEKMPKDFLCSCGKSYKHASSLWNHRKKCDGENVKKTQLENEIIPEDIDYKGLLIRAMEQMSEQQKTMTEMIDKIGTSNNTTNNTMNNITNNNFNINMFLNEKCKDAINFSDFIDRIEVSHHDLENNAQLGFVKGITKILMDNLNQLTLYQRPIHCTDTKRETLYIKDSDTWEKEHSDKKMEGAIQQVSRKSIGSLLQWKQTNPEYENMDSEFSNKCLVMQRQSLAGYESDLLYPKIIHNIAKENVINKNVAMK